MVSRSVAGIAAAQVAQDRAGLGPLSPSEKKVLALFAVLIVLWVASTWVKALDVALVALVGSLAVFLPGMRLLSWSEAQRGVAWNALLVIGGAASSHHNPALYALPVAFTASCAFLLPLDAVPLVTYGRGYYRMFDMLRPGAVISLAWVVWITILTAALGPALGLL